MDNYFFGQEEDDAYRNQAVTPMTPAANPTMWDQFSTGVGNFMGQHLGGGGMGMGFAPRRQRSPAGMYPSDLQYKDTTNRDRLGMALMGLSAVNTPRFDPIQMAGIVMLERRQNAIHNDRLRAMTRPKRKWHNGTLVEIPAEYIEDPNGNGLVPNPDMSGVNVLHTLPTADSNTTVNADDAIVGPDGRVVWQGSQYGQQTTDPLDQKDWSGMADTQVDNLRADVKPYEPGVANYENALQISNIYADTQDDITTGTAPQKSLAKAQRTQADRALVKLVEKTWDPNSAVMQGEFESATEAQAYLDSLQKDIDPTTGEILSDDARKAMLGIVDKAQQNNMQSRSRVYSDYYNRNIDVFGTERIGQVIPPSYLNPDGTLKDMAFDYTPYTKGLQWAGLREPAKQEKKEKPLNPDDPYDVRNLPPIPEWNGGKQ